jgi:hypothetical protein
MRGLCYHYGVELHNFAPNAISQAATFVVVCEGFLGIPVNWDLWVHLFRAELHTLTTPEPRVHRVVHAGGLSISLWESRREPDLPPYIGKVLKEKADSWWHGLSPSSRHDRLESALLTFKGLADAGLGAALVLANLHHRRIIPLMERELCIYEMGGGQPRVAGTLTVGTRPLPPGVRSHEGEERHQPQGRERRAGE